MYFKLYLLTVVSFLKIGASIMVTGRDVYGPVVGRWLCNDNWMRLTVTPKGGVKMLHSHVGWHHRFLSVAFAWFYPYLVFTTVHICYVDGFALIATSIAYGRCVFGEFQLFSWSW